MPKLADALRGYQPPTTSALADPIVEHFRNLPQTLATNQQAMDNTMAGMYKTDMGTGQPNPNYYPEAMGEFTQMMPNVGGMMIGPSSALWNKANAFNAAKMLKQGVPAEDVWKATGTAKGLENAFRQEISDEPALLKGTGNFGEIFEKRKIAHGVTTPTIEEVMRHPQLFESYPELKNIQVHLLPETSRNNASYSPVEGIIRVNPSLPADKATSSILHELQHGVQEIEGWNKGADANTILKNYQQQLDDIDTRLTEANLQAKKAVGTPDYDKLMAIRDKISKEYRDLTGTDIRGIYGKAMDEYKAHGGEAEARLTQARQKLNDEERKNVFPFAKGANALDINPEDAIIKMKHDSPTITRKEMLEQLLNEQK
jgi:hypothetical protein